MSWDTINDCIDLEMVFQLEHVSDDECQLKLQLSKVRDSKRIINDILIMLRRWPERVMAIFEWRQMN